VGTEGRGEERMKVGIEEGRMSRKIQKGNANKGKTDGGVKEN
jgi:hypothetical protein